MFYIFNLESPYNFSHLVDHVNFEPVTNGRTGAVLVKLSNDLVPLVRTTTIYSKPAQTFPPAHLDLIGKIKDVANGKFNIQTDFNNGLCEIYGNEYRSMGAHSDQALDLEPDSWICVYSFYSNPDTKYLRTLKISNKKTGELNSIKMPHNSVIMFSTQTNQAHLHKIVLDSNRCNSDSKIDSDTTKWFGLTLRQSKTFIKFSNGIPRFYPEDQELHLANTQEKKEFYIQRGLENKLINFTYGIIHYTISQSDLMPVTSSIKNLEPDNPPNSC